MKPDEQNLLHLHCSCFSSMAYVCIYIHTQTHTHTHTHTHIYIYIYIYIHTHTQFPLVPSHQPVVPGTLYYFPLLLISFIIIVNFLLIILNFLLIILPFNLLDDPAHVANFMQCRYFKANTKWKRIFPPNLHFLLYYFIFINGFTFHLLAVTRTIYCLYINSNSALASHENFHFFSFIEICCFCCCCCSVTKSYLNPWDPIISFVHEIFQARILKWVAISSSRVSSRPRDGAYVSQIGRWIF